MVPAFSTPRTAGILVLAFITGCGRDESIASKLAETPLRGVAIAAGAVGDPRLVDLLAPQRGEWMASRKAELGLKAGATSPDEARSLDVVLYPADAIGDLVDAGALAVLSEPDLRTPSAAALPDEKLEYDGIAPSLRDEVARYGDERLGLPIGSSTLVLVCRREALKGAAIPATWEQLDALARSLNGRDLDGDGTPEAGISLALGEDAEGVGDAIFLGRAACLGLRPDRYSFLFDAETMSPRIASAPFVEALRRIVGLKDVGPENMNRFDAEAARSAFREGRSALLIDRAERAPRWTDPKRPMAVVVAPLPGSSRLFDPDKGDYENVSTPNRVNVLPGGGGWLAGVSASATGVRREAALDLAKYLCVPETSARLLADRSVGMSPTRLDQMDRGPRLASGVDPRTWRDAVRRSLAGPRVVPGLRVPGATAYMAELGRARATAAGGGDAEAALSGAAAAWSRRVEKYGRQRALWHYRRSLVAPPTSPSPPPRGT